VAKKVVHFSAQLILETVQNKMKRISPNVPRVISRKYAPRRRQFDPKIAADLRPSADESAHLWWPAIAKLQAASVPIPQQQRHKTDRRTDRAIPKCPSRAGHNKQNAKHKIQKVGFSVSISKSIKYNMYYVHMSYYKP